MRGAYHTQATDRFLRLRNNYQSATWLSPDRTDEGSATGTFSWQVNVVASRQMLRDCNAPDNRGMLPEFRFSALCQHKLNPAPPDPLLLSRPYMKAAKKWGEILPEAFRQLRNYLPVII